jgi:hypothetical protein
MEDESMAQPLIEASGHSFSSDEMALIRQTVKTFSNLSLKELSKTLCELLEWKRPSGKLKYEECRAFLERLQADGLVTLPKLRNTAAPGPKKVLIPPPQSDQPISITGSAGQFEPLSLRLVQAADRDLLRTFKQLIERWHYLGYRIPFGAHLNYLIESPKLPGQFLACLQFSSPAWKMAPRDAWIGWTDDQRKRNLQFIVSNSRFLIPPYVSIKGLASMTLSLAARRLPDDWERLYGYRPMLMETLVERDRFAGTVYKAANWIHLGCTQGRGRMDRDHAAHGKSIKDIYVYPLCRHTQESLRNAMPPAFVDNEESEAFV